MSDYNPNYLDFEKPLLEIDNKIKAIKTSASASQKDINIVKPGFINIKFKPIFWTKFIEQIINNSKVFGINNKEKKRNYLIKFVNFFQKNLDF